MDQNATNNGGYGQAMTSSSAYPPAESSQASHNAGFLTPQFSESSQTFGGNGSPVNPPSFAAPEVPNSAGNSVANSTNNVSTTTEFNIPQEPPQIEVEWVDKVNNIVKNTFGDPFNKSYQLALLKSEYIKSVYGKIIDEKEPK